MEARRRQYSDSALALPTTTIILQRRAQITDKRRTPVYLFPIVSNCSRSDSGGRTISLRRVLNRNRFDVIAVMTSHRRQMRCSVVLFLSRLPVW